MNCRVDIGILWDDTATITDEQWGQIAEFTKNLANRTGLSDQGALIGVTTYGSSSSLLIKLSDHTEYKNFAAAVDGLLATRERDFATMLRDGLAKSLDEMFNVAYGARPNFKKVLILITDGECFNCKNEKELYSNLAGRIKDEDIRMLMIGVGITYDQVTDFNIAEFVGRNDFTEIKDYKDLIGSDLLNEMGVVCDGK